jgi:hypothetical protein
MRRLLPCSLPGLRDSLESGIRARGEPDGPHSLGLRPAGRPTHPRISKAVEKNDALPAVDVWCGEAIAMAGYVASATTAGTHDGTLNIEGRRSSARNQCVLILRSWGRNRLSVALFLRWGLYALT